MKKIPLILICILLMLIVFQPIINSNEQKIDDIIEIEDGSHRDTTLKILFIGSSYFNYNNLPDLFENLAISSGKEVYVDHHGQNGLFLSDHAESSETESKINEHNWDFVILQGSGRNMAYPDYFTDHPVYPALITLRDKIYENCESTK